PMSPTLPAAECPARRNSPEAEAYPCWNRGGLDMLRHAMRLALRLPSLLASLLALAPTDVPAQNDTPAAAEHPAWWALTPWRTAVPPEVADAAWAQHPVDRFIAAGLAAAGLTPGPSADRRT